MSEMLAGFGEALEDYMAELRRRGKSEATLRVYGHHLRDLGLFLASPEMGVEPLPTCLADVGREHVARFRDHEIARQRRASGGGPLATSTLCVSLTAVRGFFRHLVRRGLVLLDPVADLQGPRRPKKLPHEVPTSRQMKRLLSAPDTRTREGKRDQAVLELLYSTGLRNAELCALRLGDVDVARRTVFVRKGKGDKQRLVPMGKKAAQALSEYLAVYGSFSRGGQGEDGAALFLNRVGGGLKPEALRQLVARNRHGARLRLRATPHSLRHACATHLLRGGAGIRQIQALLGHESLESTEIYTKVETSDLRAMLDRHHPRSTREDPEDET